MTETSEQDATGARVLEGASLGVQLGLLHGFVESSLLGWYGLSGSTVDLAITTLLPAAGAALGGALIGLLSGGRDGPSLRTRVFGGVTAVYSAAFLWTLMQAGLTSTNIGIGAAGVAVAVIVALRVVRVRGGERAGFFAIATTVFSLLLYGAVVASVYEGNLAEFRAWLVGFSAAALAAFFAVTRRPTVGRANVARRGWATIVGFAAAWLLVWTFILPLPNRWSVRATPARIGADASGRTDVVLIVLDTVRADHLDLFGYERETMPLLKRIAEEEFDIVTTATSPSNWTLPSHASMFTGLYPATHGAHRPFAVEENPVVAHGLREDRPTLAEYLEERGYQTAGIVANYGVLSGFGLERGFLHYDAAPGEFVRAESMAWAYQFQVARRSPGNLIRKLLPEAVSRRTKWFNRYAPQARRAEQIRAEAKRWLDGAGPEPFFLFLNFFDAHHPYVPVEQDDELFGGRPEGVDWIGFPIETFEDYLRGEPVISQAEIDYMAAQYDAELRGLDRGLNRVFEDLKASGRFDEALIIVTSDHGESFGEHGFLKHEGTLGEPQVGVPLLIKLPESMSAPAMDDPSLLQAVDFFPTVVSVIGEEAPGGLEGAAWGRGRAYARAEAFCFVCSPASGMSDVERLREDLSSVRFGSVKTHWSTRRDGPETYDLSTDPKELRNVAGQFEEIESDSAEVLRSREFHLPEGEDKSPDKSTLDALRGLGYIQ